jgi:predicted metal-dependent phosphotriesterase family hydrolase
VLVETGVPVEAVAAGLGRRVGAVAMKCQRLGLEVVVNRGFTTTTSIQFPKELPSVEEA